MRTRLTWMILASGAVSPSRRHTRRPTIRTFRSACRSMRLEAATSIAVTPHWLSVRQQHLAAELNANPYFAYGHKPRGPVYRHRRDY